MHFRDKPRILSSSYGFVGESGYTSLGNVPHPNCGYTRESWWSKVQACVRVSTKLRCCRERGKFFHYKFITIQFSDAGQTLFCWLMLLPAAAARNIFPTQNAPTLRGAKPFWISAAFHPFSRIFLVVKFWPKDIFLKLISFCDNTMLHKWRTKSPLKFYRKKKKKKNA